MATDKKENPEKEETKKDNNTKSESKKDNNTKSESKTDNNKENRNSKKTWAKIGTGAAAIGMAVGAWFGGRAWERKHPKQ